MNNVVIVGRITRFKGNEVMITVNRNYKDEDGGYMSDLIYVCVGMNMAEQMEKYCKISDVIAVKGRLENRGNIVVVAEKVTFISSKKAE